MASKMNQNNKSINPFHHPEMLVRIRQPVNHLSEATSGYELTQNDRIHQEQTKEKQQLFENISVLTGKALTHSDGIYLKDFDEIQLVENSLHPTGHGSTHSYRIFPSLFENIRQPVDDLSGATTGNELTQSDRIHQEKEKQQPVENISVLTRKALTQSDGIYPKDFDEIRLVENLLPPTGHGLTHSYLIFPSLFENIRQPVDHLSGATTGQELTQPVKNISVLTGKALTHSDGIYPKDFDEMQLAESSSGPAHSYQIYPSLFENLCHDTLDVARSNCSKVIGEVDLPHSDPIPPTQLEKMFRPGNKFSWSMDEVLMLGDRIYPMQFDQMSKPAYNFSFSIKNAMMLGGRYYPLKINIRKEVQCSYARKSRKPIVLDL